jgi:hypothetical protein
MTKKPHYIPEPYGLPFELTEAGKFRKSEVRKKKILGIYTERQWDEMPLYKRGKIISKLLKTIKLRKVI